MSYVLNVAPVYRSALLNLLRHNQPLVRSVNVRLRNSILGLLGRGLVLVVIQGGDV